MEKVENKRDIIDCYFEDFIFSKLLEKDKQNTPWVRGAQLIVKDICDSKKMSLQKLIKYFSFEGDKFDLKTFKNLESDLKQVKNGAFYMPDNAKNTRLGYYQALAESVDLYLENRDKELERVFDAFIKNGVSLSTIQFCVYAYQNKKKNMTKRECYMQLYELMEYLMSMDINTLLRQEVNKIK